MCKYTRVCFKEDMLLDATKSIKDTQEQSDTRAPLSNYHGNVSLCVSWCSNWSSTCQWSLQIILTLVLHHSKLFEYVRDMKHCPLRMCVRLERTMSNSCLTVHLFIQMWNFSVIAIVYTLKLLNQHNLVTWISKLKSWHSL